VRGPVGEEIVQDRVELLVRRMPGLEQVVVQTDVVDSGDRRLGVRVGGQEDPLRLRVEREDLEEELRAGHLRHPLVDQEERHGRPALLQLPRRLRALRARSPLSGRGSRCGSAGAGRARSRRGLPGRRPR
jgi:hypothetical protein